MRNYKFILIVLASSILFSCNRPEYDYDYIIVGGGLAGLSAAHELNSHRVLIIERDSVLGGRVKTHNYKSRFYYDLGAVFALDSSFRSNLKIDYNEIIEDGKIGFWINDNLYDGHTVLECLTKVPELNIAIIERLSEDNTLNSDNLDSNLYNILNTNMKAVFPGALKNYNTVIQKFAFQRYNSSHFVLGNNIVLDYYLRNKMFSQKLSSEVISVEDKKSKVEVIYLSNGKTDTLLCKKAIVATTASAAKKIIKNKSPECMDFLDGVKYAGYYSIAIGVDKNISKNDVSYLMPVGSGFSSVLKQKTTENDFTIFQLYIAEEDFSAFENDDDIKLKAKVLLNQIWDISERDIVFYDKYFWKEAGVLVDNHYLKKWSDKNLKSGNNIFLAGDYCIINHFLPYGMIPAIVSGTNAAKNAKL